MVNVDVFKKTIENDLKEIAIRKLDILILQRQNETLCKTNNEEIKKLNEEIENRLSTSESLLKRFVCNELKLDFDNPKIEAERFSTLWCKGIANLTIEKRKIETSAGSVIYKLMPDEWIYDIPKLINWAKENEDRKVKYIKVIEEFKKAELKKDIADKLVDYDDVVDEGLTIKPQEPKFNYKLNGGL